MLNFFKNLIFKINAAKQCIKNPSNSFKKFKEFLKYIFSMNILESYRLIAIYIFLAILLGAVTLWLIDECDAIVAESHVIWDRAVKKAYSDAEEAVRNSCNFQIEHSVIVDKANENLIKESITNFVNNNCIFNLESFHFRTGFNNNKTYISSYLSLWQYWWWFWFIALVFFYYLLAFRHLVFRQKKFYPKINTSLKSHGKWGDFIIAFIPVFWCLNILINSNTLLKIFEWQYESNFLNLRIRGKQWYWVYKLDFLNLKKINDLVKNVGNDNFIIPKAHNNFNEKIYLYFEKLWGIKWYKKYENQIIFSNKFKNNINWLQNRSSKISNLSVRKITLSRLAINNGVFFKNFLFSKYFCKFLNKEKIIYNFFFLLCKNKFLHNYGKYDFNFFSKNIISKIQFEIFYDNFGSFFIKWGDNVSKPISQSYSTSLKQKRIEFNAKSKFFTHNYFSKNNYLFLPFKKYNSKNNSLISNRLLSTNFTLVMPSNIVVSIITNSFDVIHSWFVPGLGIKMDCVPGKSTHHSFFFDVSGLFYGQCAEVCGRFHHHMPIKIYVTHFELFLLWINHVFLKFIYIKKNY